MATKAKKPSSKKAKADTNEISAVASEDLFETFLGNLLPNPDQVVDRESQGLGLQLYEQMEDKDGHIATVIQTRKLAVIGREWEVLPASDSAEDEKKAEFVEQVFKKMSFDAVRLAQMDALMKGFAVSEIIWELSEGQIWIKTFKHRKPWRFVFDVDRQLRMLTDQQMVEGEKVPMDKFWIYTFGERYENPYGKPLGQKLFWSYLFKKNNIKWWAIFNEKFGSPTPVGKYRPGTPKSKQDLLLSAIKSMQQETAVVIPDDMAIEFLEAARKGSFDTYKGFLNWFEELQSKIVLGQTLTTQQGENGARSLGEVHDEVRQDILKADADSLMESLNDGPVKLLVDLNFPGTVEYPQVWIRTESEKDLKPLAERDKLITEMGFELDEQYIKDTYSVEVRRKNQPRENPDPDKSEFAESDDQDNLDPFVNRLLKEAGQDALIDPIKKLLDESESLEEFRDNLAVAFNDMDVTDLGNIIQLALQAAELAGRFEALPGEEKE